MEAQTLLPPIKPPETQGQKTWGVLTTVLAIMCAVLTCTLLWYHHSMQPKGTLSLVRIFSLTRDVQAATADFAGEVTGQLAFQIRGDYISITGKLSHLAPGVLHGIHILSISPEDLIDRSAFHFLTEKTKHGCPGVTAEFHAGDLGNIAGDETGSVEVSILTNAFGLSEILGRVVAITKGKDLCVSAEDADILAMAALAAAQPKKDFLKQ